MDKMDIFKKCMNHMASFIYRNVPCPERYRTMYSHSQLDSPVLRYK